VLDLELLWHGNADDLAAVDVGEIERARAGAKDLRDLRGDECLGGEVVALDGKALRRARGRSGPVRTIVSAWATEHGLALGQSAVMDKSNESSGAR
jgi:hypothetical protein